MGNLATKEKKNIGKRVADIRIKLNIPKTSLAKALILSKGNIQAIEAGNASSIDNMLMVVHFLGMTLSEASSPEYTIPLEPQLRERILAFHEKHKISDKDELLKIMPEVKTVIKDRLLPDGHLDDPKPVSAIIQICKDEYDFSLSTSSITNAMKKVIKEGLVRIINPKEKNFLYQKVQ